MFIGFGTKIINKSNTFNFCGFICFEKYFLWFWPFIISESLTRKYLYTMTDSSMSEHKFINIGQYRMEGEMKKNLHFLWQYNTNVEIAYPRLIFFRIISVYLNWLFGKSLRIRKKNEEVQAMAQIMKDLKKSHFEIIFLWSYIYLFIYI